MASLVDVFVNVVPKTDRFEPDLKRRLAKIDGDKEGRRIGKGLGAGITAGLGKALLAGAAVIGSFGLFKSFLEEGREAQRTAKLTAAAIKSTGGAARITARQVASLAGSISNQVGVDDELIQSSQNLLLTFTRVRNETGKGNNVFDQASRAIVDMTAAMNNGEISQNGLKASTIQVGKALNDPIKGLTALGRVGVKFTDQQREQIKAMVAAGNVAGAQKVILRELTTEFGGAAEAAADPGKKLAVVFDNIKETIGGALLPVIDRLATFLADKLPGAVEKVGQFISTRLIPAFKGIRDLVIKGDFTGALRQAFGIEEDNPLIRVILRIRNGIIGLVKLLAQGDFSAQFRKAFGVEEDSGLVRFLLTVREAVIAFAGYLRTTAIPAVVEFAQTWLPRLGAAAVAVAKFFREQVFPAAATVAGFLARTFGPTVRALGQFITGSLIPALAGIAEKLRENAPQLIAFAKFLAIVIGVVLVLAAKIAGFLIPIMIRLAGVYIRVVATAIGVVITAIGLLIRGVQQIVGALQWLGNFSMAMWAEFKRVAREAILFVLNAFLLLVGSILNGASKAFGWIPGIGPKLREAAKAFNVFRQQVNTALGGIEDQTVAITTKVYRPGTGPNQATLAKGARLPGYGGGDIVPAMLEPGETVVPKHLTPEIAPWARMHGIPGFAAGGVAGGVSVVPRMQSQAELAAVAAAISRSTAAAVKTAIDQLLAKLGSGGGNVPGAPRAVGGNAAIVQRIFATMFGWAGPQWNSAYRLIMGESGFRNTAQNPTSSAYGMFQFLNGTWAGVGGYKTADPTLQAIFGGRYIQQRYGNPVRAYSAWLSRSPHWYDSGGWLPTGVSVAVNNTGKPERVLGPGQAAAGVAIGEVHVHDGVDLDLLVSRIGFAQRAGAFT